MERQKTKRWLGILLFAALAMLPLVVFFVHKRVGVVLEGAGSAMTMKTIYTALHLYSQDNSGLFPPEDNITGLKRLLDARDFDPRCLTCSSMFPPASSADKVEETNTSYIYIGGHGVSSPAHTIVLIEKPSLSLRHGRVMVCLADGRAIRLEDVLIPDAK